ncbi:unnamed protein product [Hermetia illucens]|uniref:Cytochrome P450 n=1 Tax=Hermetia illucens TaxID=343691 RepID=A0A7R8UGA5_HERIL|nr:probable cytochrome P450 6a14 isoform X2 [Hermetia illucens]CAD7080276.1 unnamed protein product [Hermetia illucens]
MLWCTVLFTLVALPIVIYLFFKWKFSYWKNRGVPSLPPIIPHGNFKGVSISKHSNDLLSETYFTFKGKSPIAGIYFFFSPIAVPIDLDLIRNILVKDFHSFHDRWFYFNEKEDPLSANMFALHGEKWKRIRKRLVKAFSAEIKLGADIEVKEILARFTTDVIGECAFGIVCNTLQNSNSEFRKFGRIALGEPRHSRLTVNALKQFPKIAEKLKCRIIRDDVTEFFFRIVRETISFREENNIHRNDFMDLLIELKNERKNGEEGNLSIEEITAQVFLFFLAGFETSSTTLSYTLYELALNSDIQNRARDEIFTVLNKYNGQLTYEALMEMQYIDQIISETLRKYPPMVTITRQATEDYRIPNTNITLEKDTSIFIPVYSIHHDPEIYPNPETYDPDRFNSGEEKRRHPLAYLAFGEGPRNCVGLRFGKMETRIAMVNLLKNFRFVKCSRTEIPLKFNNAASLLTTKGGIFLKVEKLTQLEET